MDMSLRKLVDKLPNNKNDYYIIVSSASGGSGSIMGVLLLKAMLEKDYNVIVVVVGDSSNLLSLNNTINAIASLQSIAKHSKKTVSIIYYNNTVNNLTSPSTEKDINNKISKMLTIISMFTSGTLQNIDHQDMNNFFRSDKYQTFRVAPGLYSIGVALSELDDSNTIMARTIIDKDTKDINIKVPLLHNKVGYITKEYDEFNTYPMFLILRKGIINEEIKYLKDEYEKLEKLKNTKYDEFNALDDADEDESGLIL